MHEQFAVLREQTLVPLTAVRWYKQLVCEMQHLPLLRIVGSASLLFEHTKRLRTVCAGHCVRLDGQPIRR